MVTAIYPTRVHVLYTDPEKPASGTTLAMSHTMASEYEIPVRNALVQHVLPHHTATILLVSRDPAAVVQQKQHYAEKDDLYYKTKLRELGTLLLTFLFLVERPHTETPLGGITPKAHFFNWLAHSLPVPLTSRFFEVPINTSEPPPSRGTPVRPAEAGSSNINNALSAGPEAKLTIDEVTKMLNALGPLTNAANDTVHSLTVTQVIRVMTSTTTSTHLEPETYKTLTTLVEAILGYPLQHASKNPDDGEKNFKKFIKAFNKRVAAAPVKEKIEKEWSRDFIKASKLKLTNTLIEEGYVVSADDHKVVTDDLKVVREELQTTLEELRMTADKLKTTDEKLKTTDEKLKTTEEKLKTTDEKLKTTDDRMSAIERDFAMLRAAIGIPSAVETGR